MPVPFLFFGGFLRLIVPLAILVAVGYFTYRKGKKDGLAEALAVTPIPAPISAEELPGEPAEAPKRRRRKIEENEESE